MIDIVFAIGTVLIFLLYFRLAIKFEIIDHPNHRSSHSNPIIRGAGIIFPIVFMLYFLFVKANWHFFLIGFLLISVVSFVDDVKTLSSKSRIIVHSFCCVLLAYQLDLMFDVSWYIYIFVPLFVVAVINAFNFMDGINGITGLYAMVTFITIYYLKDHLKSFLDEKLLIWFIITCLVFLFFNFRIQAKCFAGDVGSVSISFLIIFLIILLVFTSLNYKYLLFLFIYGLDTAYTIVFRKIRGEKLTEAHRLHLYQLLVHEYKLNHLLISAIYAVFQLLLNVWIITFARGGYFFMLPFFLLLVIMEVLRYKIKFSILHLLHFKLNLK